MSRRRNPELGEDFTDIPNTVEESAAQDAPIPGYVRLVNLTSSIRDITLYDGTNVKLHPFQREGETHISPPIPKKLLPDVVRKMIVRRELKVLEGVK